MLLRFLSAILLPACFAPCLLPVQAQDGSAGRPVVHAVPLEAGGRIHLDGRVDEAAWREADPAAGFRQQEPREGAEPTERTEVRILFDRTHLYLGVVLYDDDPEGILAYQRRRDASLATDDRFMWILDTFADGRSAYFFEINPAGLKGDGLLRAGQGFGLNKSWDGIWEVRTARGSYGWSAEIKIPFRTLNFDPDRGVWGINFQRTIRRKSEELLWSGHPRNQGLFRPQSAGRLVGLAGLSQGIGLEVKPYTAASSSRTWTENGLEVAPNLDAGLDFTYSLTTNLRASLTVNTDFAEAEVDQRRVNLTRFPLFFPEQRDFFLEGSSVFSFAPSSAVYPYFSRRIGLEGGNPIPILFGARVAGQVGDFDVGLLQVRTGEQGLTPVEDFTAGRVVRHVLSESTVGLVYTRRATHFGEAEADPLLDRHTLGADLELATSEFLGDRVLQFQSFFVWHNAPVPGDTTAWWDRSGRGVRLAYPNAPWYAHVSYREFGAAYDPAVGFASRVGFRRLQPSVEYTPLLEQSRLVRELLFGLRFEYLTDLDFRPETVETRLTLLGVRFESGDEARAEISRNFERLPFPFDIRRDGSIVIPPGPYHTWSWTVEAASAGYRRVAGSASWTHEGFWTGARTQVGLGLSIKPLAGIALSGLWRHDRIALQEGRFQTHLIRVAGSLDLSPRLSVAPNVQYDNLSRLVGFYGRLRWIIRPGSDLYLVYTHNVQDPLTRFRSLESQAATKLTYTHRF